MLILLPPSEGKDAARRGPPLANEGLSFPGLGVARSQVLDALVELCEGDPEVAAKTLAIGSTQLDLIALNATLRTAPTARADRVYAGVLYDALDLASLSAGAKRRASSRLVVTSSLFGLVRPTDRIPAYRLSGNAVLPGLGSVAGIWRSNLGPTMKETLGDGLLVDLRSSMYAAFWRPPADIGACVATIRVLHEINGKRQVVSHFNKATKGRIVRAMLEDGRGPRTPRKLADLLVDLGWQVEVGEATTRGTQLDVVVSIV